MQTITNRTAKLYLGLAISLAIAAVFIVSETVARPSSEPAGSEYEALSSLERAKPRFVGEIGGIFLAPFGTSIPDGFLSYESICGSAPTVDVSWEEAGELDLRIDLPAMYVLQEDDVNTSAIACNGIVYAARRAYAVDVLGELDAYVLIGRSILDYDEIDVAHDRPKLMRIAGRDVVVVSPLTNSPFDSGAAWISEPFGKTVIQVSGLPRQEFVELVRLVASSTRSR